MTKSPPAKAIETTDEERKSNLLVSLKRTLVPILVGSTAASFLGPYIDQAVVQSFVSGLISAFYYVSIRFVENLWPEAGVLLGSKAQPTYAPTKDE